MNKTSRSQHRTHLLTTLVFILCALMSLAPVPVARADAAPPPDPTVGGVGPYQPQKTNVQMMSETVFIDVQASPPRPEPTKPIKVRASFTMRNQGQTEEQMQVIFPLSRLGHDNNPEQALYLVSMSSFVAKVNGKPVPISQITTPAEFPEDVSKMESGFTMEVLWAAFPVTFPVKQDVLLQVEYEMPNSYPLMEGAEFTGIEYILETGAGWYGNILSADITVRLPFLVDEAAIRYARPGYVAAGREMRWTLKDFEPTRKDNLYVRIVYEETWRSILDLRAKVKQNPRDVDSWVELADWYTYHAISNQLEGAFPYHLNHRTSDLAVEARRTVVALRPEWGDAHFWLAEILWYTNPKVEAIWGTWNGVGEHDTLRRDDPSIQEALHELDLAESYGVSEGIKWAVGRLVEMINRTIPGLELTAPPTATLTPILVSPTIRPTSTAIEFAPPSTVSSLLMTRLAPTAAPAASQPPTASPTPIPIEKPARPPYGALITAALGLGILVGVFAAYRSRAKSEDKRG